MNEYLQKYLNFLEFSGYSKYYRDSTRTNLNQFISYFVSQNKNFIELQPSDIREFFLFFQRSGKWNSSNTFIYKLQHLKKFYEFINNEGIAQNNPVKEIVIPNRPTEKIRKFIPPKELDKFDRVVRENKSIDLRTKTIWFLARSSGARSQEMASILREDINFDDRLILVRTSKNRRPKYIPFSKEAARYLNEWILMTRYLNTIYLFPKKHKLDEHINRIHIYLAMREVEATVYPRVNDTPDRNRPNGAHVLRHTFVQEWCEKGNDLRGLQWILGWSSLAPLESYLHMTPQLIKEHYQKFERKKWKRK